MSNYPTDWHRKRFDAVIIGAGISGLCAGAILSAKGKSVLVVDKNDQVGGRGRCIPYGDGFYISNNFRSTGVDYVNKAAEMCGAKYELCELPEPVLSFYNIDQQRYFKKDPDYFTYFGNLGITDPAEVQEILRLLDAMIQVPEAERERFEREGVSFYDWITKQTSNVKMQKAVFDVTTYSSHSIFDWTRFGAGEFFSKVMPIMKTGDHKIYNGNPTDQAIVDAFAKVILDNGGEISLLSEAKKVFVQDGKATGVMFVDNHFDTWKLAETDHVITSLPIWENRSIIDPSLFSKEWHEYMNAYSTFQGIGIGVWYGLKEYVSEVDNFIRLLSEHKEIGTQGKYQGGAMFLSNNSPGQAPKGKQIFFIEKFEHENLVNQWDVIDNAVNTFRKWTPELFEAMKRFGVCTKSFHEVVEFEKVAVHRPSWGVVQWSNMPKPEIPAPGIAGLLFIGDTVKGGNFGYDLAAHTGIQAAELVLAGR